MFAGIPTFAVDRRERIAVALLAVCGIALRAWNLSSAGADHFDEGVYLFSALGISDPVQPFRLFPGQPNFSPPLHFLLMAASLLLNGGPSDAAGIWVSVVTGTLTIVAVWSVGRRWFGPAAGVSAAALLCFNEYHIAFSRAPLTDVTFAFFFLLSLAAVANAIGGNRLRTALIAGLLIGLAWNTKYHGWFASMIAAIALAGMWWQNRPALPERNRGLILWASASAVATACFVPWAVYVERWGGGYLNLMKHQRTFVGRDYWGAVVRQTGMQSFFEGPWTRLSPLIAVLLALWVLREDPRLSPRWILIGLLCGVAPLVVGGAGAAVMMAALAVPAILRLRSYSGWLLVAWLAVWALSTPAYRPYARLLLPFTIASHLAAGFWISRTVAGGLPDKQDRRMPLALTAAACAAIAGIAFVLPAAANPWRPSDSMRSASASITQLIPAGQRVIVIGEPPLAFYLHLAGRPAFDRPESMRELATIETPVYIVSGIYAKRAPALREGLERLSHRLKLLGVFKMDPSDVRLTDSFTPREAVRFRERPDDSYDLSVYLLQPEGQREDQAVK